MAFRLRPSLVTAAFGVLLAVVADLAWATALTTTGPWFGASVGLAVYSAALIVPTVLAVVLVHQATVRVDRLDASLARLDRRIALLRSAHAARGRTHASEQVFGSRLGEERFADGGSAPLVLLEREGHDTLVPLPAESRDGAARARTEVLRQLVRERVAILEARTRVGSTVAGPVLASLVFVAIAGPMLPGSDGFAAAHYVLNTALILFLSYGFAPLVGWSLLALGMMGSFRGRPPP